MTYQGVVRQPSFTVADPGEGGVKKIKINFDNTQNRFIFVLVNQLSYENKRR